MKEFLKSDAFMVVLMVVMVVTFTVLSIPQSKCEDGEVWTKYLKDDYWTLEGKRCAK